MASEALAVPVYSLRELMLAWLRVMCTQLEEDNLDAVFDLTGELLQRQLEPAGQRRSQPSLWTEEELGR